MLQANAVALSLFCLPNLLFRHLRMRLYRTPLEEYDNTYEISAPERFPMHHSQIGV
jgi:hypothetical protein